MKHIILSLLTVCVFIQTYAQAPDKMSYQAVVRNNSNQLVCNQQISMKISILQGMPNGNTVYSEIQMPVTSVYGMVAFEIGTGITNNTFSSIDWAADDYFVKVETDLTGGNNYSITSISQMLSVPYAFYAKTSGSSIPGPKGDDGKSAYDIWREAGNTGTQTDFLAALKGTKGDKGDKGDAGATGPQGPAGPPTTTFAICMNWSSGSLYNDCSCSGAVLLSRVRASTFCGVTSDTGSCSAAGYAVNNNIIGHGSCCVCRPQ